MQVLNLHHQTYSTPKENVEKILASLATANDQLWPHELWPAMRFKGGLTEGAKGGHLPIGYVVEMKERDHVVFRFNAPNGFIGTHEFNVTAKGQKTELCHAIQMQARGVATLMWVLAIRPLHDALLEDALAKVGQQLSENLAAPKWSLWVRLLRWGTKKLV